MTYIKFISLTILVIILTLITQIGGIVLLAAIPIFRWINKRFQKRLNRVILKFASFLFIYLLATFALVPMLAPLFGRVPLPYYPDSNIKPLNIMTVVLNRHYVRPELRSTVEQVSDHFQTKYPESLISYLDANFPFFNGFPLLPHLSHNDGKKLDLAFYYEDNETGESLANQAPSLIGYGVYEGPSFGEPNMPEECRSKGFWQYSSLQYLVPQGKKTKMSFDEERTKYLINALVQDPGIGKVFIEPHLKTRMNLSNEKIRFHGCQAVRHDDHIHIQLK